MECSVKEELYEQLLLAEQQIENEAELMDAEELFKELREKYKK